MDLYSSENAYYYDSSFKRTPRPGQRDHYSGTAVIPGTSLVTSLSPFYQVYQVSYRKSVTELADDGSTAAAAHLGDRCSLLPSPMLSRDGLQTAGKLIVFE